MTNPLTLARETLTTALKEGGLKVADHGAPLRPPGVMILAADDWLTPGDTFGGWIVQLQVHAITGQTLTRSAILALEDLTATAAAAAAGMLGPFGPPTAETFGDSVYLTATATATIYV